MNYELKKKKEKEIPTEKAKSPLETYGSLVEKLADFKADPAEMQKIMKSMEGLYLEAKKEKKETEKESNESEKQSFELIKDKLKEDQQRLAQIRAIEKAAGFNTDKTEAAIEKEIRDENADIQKKAKVLAKSQSYRSAGEKTPTEGESSEVQEEMEDSEYDKENNLDKFVTKKTGAIESVKDDMAYLRLNLEAKKKKKGTKKEPDKKEMNDQNLFEKEIKRKTDGRENKNWKEKLKQGMSKLQEDLVGIFRSREMKKEITKKMAKETIESIKEEIKSPAYLRRLTRELYGDEKEAKKMQAERLKNVEDLGEPEYVDLKKMDYELFIQRYEQSHGVKPSAGTFEAQKKKGSTAKGVKGFYNSDKHRLYLPDNAYDVGIDFFKEIVRHETSHASTRIEQAITAKAAYKLFSDSYVYKGDNMDGYFSNYWEMLPRKQELVRDAEKLKIIKPGADFSDKAVDELLNRYKNNPKYFNRNSREFLDRIDTETPKGRQLLKKVLNEIAKNENKKENDDNYKMAA